MTNLETKQQAKAATPDAAPKAATPEAAPKAATPEAAPKAATPEAAPAAAAASGGGSGLKSEGIFNMMSAYLSGGNGKDLIPKVDAIFGFQITPKKGAKVALIYEIDLKNG